MNRIATAWAKVERVVFGRRAFAIVFAMGLVFFAYFFHRFRFWNVNSRLALTYALVEDGSCRIDRFVNHPHFATQDRAFYGGHYYSDKIIGLSLLAAAPYWVLHRVAGWLGKDPKPDLSRYVLTVCVVSTSAAALSVVLARTLLLLGLRTAQASRVALFASFGTPFLPFSSLFYPYLPSLFFMTAAFYWIIRRKKMKRLRECSPWLPGGLIGLALLCEYTLAVPAGLLSLYYGWALTTESKIHNRGHSFLLQLILFFAAIAVPLIPFAIYNRVCFGTPWTLPYRYLDSPEFRAGMSQGLMGIGHFQWYVLLLVTLHPYRGLFFYSPFLLLGGAGLIRTAIVGRRGNRLLAVLGLVTVVYYLILNASYYMWWGGGTPLARHLIPAVVPLVLGIAGLRHAGGAWLRILGAVSIALIVSLSVVEPHFQPAQSDAELYHPWQTVTRLNAGLPPPAWVHSWPELAAGRISMNPFNWAIFATPSRLWTLAPLVAVEAGLLGWLRRSLRPPRQTIKTPARSAFDAA